MFRLWLQILGLVLVVVAIAFGAKRLAHRDAEVLPATVADVTVLHSGVDIGERPARGRVRVTEGQRVATDGDGRARARLDDGTLVLFDRNTQATLGAGKIVLEQGRLFVTGGATGASDLTLGGSSVRVASANLGVERTAARSRVYSVTTEISLTQGNQEHKVRAGESAVLEGDQVKVAAERAFEDWTGGLAVPWLQEGRAVGELWGKSPSAQPGDPGSPLTLRSQDVRVNVVGEMAETTVTITFFNGGSETVSGDFRMAVPDQGILSRVSVGRSDSLEPLTLALASRDEATLSPEGPLVEWAGDGWLRATLPHLASGGTVTVELQWIEWLPVRYGSDGSLLAQYRFPLASSMEAPLIGELSIQLQAEEALPRAIAAGLGATVEGSTVSVRRPDFRPTADFVVDLALVPPESRARMYVAPGDESDPARTIVVRADLPEPTPADHVRLALLVDTSGSMEAGQLEVARAFVRALLDSLGGRDQVVVLAADQDVASVGPAGVGPLDAARKTATLAALDQLSPGGASDLERALTRAADLLGDEGSASMVVYVGDGFVTAGESNVERILDRLSRRVGGTPRLGAVAVGPVAETRALAALTRGSRALFRVFDSPDAAGAAAELMSRALVPSFSDVALDLGPEVEQVYPRGPRTALAGEPFVVVGKLRGPAPREAVLRYRDHEGAQELRRVLASYPAKFPDDVRRRWARARVDAVLAEGQGREAVTDVALSTALLTPWTGFRASAAPYAPSPASVRLLTFDSTEAAPVGFGAIASLPLHRGLDTGEEGYRRLVSARVARHLDSIFPQVRACRDSRAALRPELAGEVVVSLEVDGDGGARKVGVRGASPASDDAALNQCVALAVGAARYPQSGLNVTIRVERALALPPPGRVGKARCSDLSAAPLAFRRGPWRSRLTSAQPLETYMAAKTACELRGWADRRALLELIFDAVSDGVARTTLARELEAMGENDAARFVRKEAVRRASTPAELLRIRHALMGEEELPVSVFERRYRAAKDDAERLAVVRRFSTVAPHDATLKLRLLTLLVALKQESALREEARLVRADPFATAEVLARAATALRELGREAEARRTFGEIAERAPLDPWARAFVADRLRNEGWYDAATTHLEVLARLAPGDPAVVIRLALAHAGAGRLDVARRMLASVIMTGGRDGSEAMGALAARLAHVLLSRARAGVRLAPELEAEIAAASLELPRATDRVVVLLRTPGALEPLEAAVSAREAGGREVRGPDVAAPGAGLYSLSFDVAAQEVELTVTRAEELPPTRPLRVSADALVFDGDGSRPPELRTLDFELVADGKPKKLRWTAQGLVQ